MLLDRRKIKRTGKNRTGYRRT